MAESELIRILDELSQSADGAFVTIDATDVSNWLKSGLSRALELARTQQALLDTGERDTARLTWLESWFVANPRGFQVAFRRLESTLEFLCRRELNPNSYKTSSGKTIRAAIDAVLGKDK